MGYIEESLSSGEYLMYRTRLHWIVFFWPSVWLLVGLALLGKEGLYAIPGGAAVIIGTVTGVKAVVRFASSEFGVTNKRVLAKVGWVRRRSFEILLSRVEGIIINQGLWGRIFDYGTVVVRGSGGSRSVFERVSMPLELRRRIQEQVELTYEK